ncbi:MAG TPA: hypothetical protein VFT45_04400 [Longimicrobium sp.]|nr:hypothetical protein [Longimicrobium sp.]
MPSPELRVSVEVMRYEAEQAVAATSLRTAADEIGMSAMGLRAFIRGEGQPQQRTLRKLNAWYARTAALRRSGGLQDARSALIVLAGLYPRADRSRVLRNLAGQLEREFHASGMPPPPWLAALSSELQGTVDAGGTPSGVERGGEIR